MSRAKYVPNGAHLEAPPRRVEGLRPVAQHNANHRNQHPNGSNLQVGGLFLIQPVIESLYPAIGVFLGLRGCGVGVINGRQ